MIRISTALFGAGAAMLAPANAVAQSRIADAEDPARLRAEISALKAQLEALEARLDRMAPPVLAVPAPPPASLSPPAVAATGQTQSTEIEWKGSPQFTQGDRSFKVKGRIQIDAGYVSAPPGLDDPAFGFTSEVRRLRLGGEGELGAGVGYKLELELSDNAVDMVDTFVSYETGYWRLVLGNHNAFQSLDELTGDTTGSFMERAAFTDAFDFERRLGLSAQYSRGPWLAQAGVFTDDIDALSDASDGPDGGDENNSFSLDQRLVYAPEALGGQLHVAASAHWRRLNRLAETPTRFRQRPYLHANNSRVLSTPELAVDEVFNYGIEGGFIRGRWHVAGEIHWLTADRPAAADPTFSGGYAEIGYFLTRGDRRGYEEGQFTRRAPARPLDGGGLGSVQLNLRYDGLSLNDGPVRGGTQRGYLAAVIWSPLRDLRLNLNYGYLRYDDAAVAAPEDDDYGVHVAGARLELDF